MEGDTMQAAGGMLFLFYAKSEESAIKPIRKECIKRGIFPVACDDPKNFKFVQAQTVSAAHLDVIGNAALQCVSGYSETDRFMRLIRAALVPAAEKKD